MRKGRIGGDLPLNRTRSPVAGGKAPIVNTHGAPLVQRRPVVRPSDLLPWAPSQGMATLLQSLPTPQPSLGAVATLGASLASSEDPVIRQLC